MATYLCRMSLSSKTTDHCTHTPEQITEDIHFIHFATQSLEPQEAATYNAVGKFIPMFIATIWIRPTSHQMTARYVLDMQGLIDNYQHFCTRTVVKLAWFRCQRAGPPVPDPSDSQGCSNLRASSLSAHPWTGWFSIRYPVSHRSENHIIWSSCTSCKRLQ